MGRTDTFWMRMVQMREVPHGFRVDCSLLFRSKLTSECSRNLPGTYLAYSISRTRPRVGRVGRVEDSQSPSCELEASSFLATAHFDLFGVIF